VTVARGVDQGPSLGPRADYLGKGLRGLGGSRAEMKLAAAALAVSFERVVQPGQSYVVDPSADYLLIAPSRRTVRTLRFAEAHLLAAKLIELLAAAGTPLDNVNNIGAYR